MSSEMSETFCRYYAIKGVEKLDKYKPGGFHPVRLGDVLHERYQIVDKLGYGGYSTVWLVRDKKEGRYVALKISIAESDTREVGILKYLANPLSRSSLLSSVNSGRKFIPTLLDEFSLEGPNGTHACYTMIPTRGNLRNNRRKDFFPLEIVRVMIYELVLAVAYIHSKGIVHGDLHSANVLIELPSSFDALSIDELYEEYGRPETHPIKQRNGEPLPPDIIPTEAVEQVCLGCMQESPVLADSRLLLIDFGQAFFPAVETRLGGDSCIPLPFRAPEAMLDSQTPLSFPSDIWSLATLIWEVFGCGPMFSGKLLFDIRCQQVAVLGHMPSEWWERWKLQAYGELRSLGLDFVEYFKKPVRSYEELSLLSLTEEQLCKEPTIEDLEAGLELMFEDLIQRHIRKEGRNMEKDEQDSFLAMIRRMLSFRSEERPTAEELLSLEWMVKYALPDYERSLVAQSDTPSS